MNYLLYNSILLLEQHFVYYRVNNSLKKILDEYKEIYDSLKPLDRDYLMKPKLEEIKQLLEEGAAKAQ
jgi:hypothetical protein